MQNYNYDTRAEVGHRAALTQLCKDVQKPIAISNMSVKLSSV